MRPPSAPDDAGDTGEAPPSKTRRKQAMHDLQALGQALVALDPATVASLGLPERLADAIALARSVTKHEARRRQMQFIGRLMRDVDPEPIRAAIDRAGAIPAAEKARFAALERWRDRLLEDDGAIDAFVSEHPEADRVAIAKLVREARAERGSGATPVRFRELFKLLKRLIEP